jgi:ASC-1-like (ASCH) protein
MEHIAIMKKEWGLLPKIISGQKTIESRWLMNQSAPWGNVHEGDTVYFKDAGEPVNVKAKVSHVLELDNLSPQRISDILDFYGEDDGISEADMPQFEALFRDKQYCVLIFLEDIKVVEPFHIDKSGFGMQTAWLTCASVRALQR